MNTITSITKRSALIFSALALVVAQALFILPADNASAAQILNRSLTLQAGASAGGSAPGGVVDHQFAFQLPGGSNVGSILFEYCTTAANTTLSPTCITPTGLVTTSAALGSETGATGFSMVNTTNGTPYLTRTASNPGTNVNVTYRLDDITNPTDVNSTFFVRISTYASTDTTGGVTDAGVVNASTAEPIDITGTMPESLVFCTGATISTTSSVPDCATATAGDIFFDQLFSPTDTATTTSQMAASTNAGFGYAITVNGETLTSGANTIDGMAALDVPITGIAQFGLNVVLNTITDASLNPLGLDPAPAYDGVDLTGQASTDYDTPDSFKFVTGETVADSDSSGTDAQIFTVSYIANVPGNQPAGTYTTTLTYICTPTF